MSYPFHIRVKSSAASMSPAAAVAILARDAARLGMTLIAEINGVEVLANPNSDPEQLAQAFRHAVEDGAKFAWTPVLSSPTNATEGQG